MDCIRLYVPDLEAGFAFYRDGLGYELIWRTGTAAGLRLPETDTELFLQTEEQRQEVDFLVDSVDQSAESIAQSGGKVIVLPFDIQIGRCAVVKDPWGNPLVLLDISRGLLKTDEDGNVIGNPEP